jgi:hypothetical protein
MFDYQRVYPRSWGVSQAIFFWRSMLMILSNFGDLICNSWDFTKQLFAVFKTLVDRRVDYPIYIYIYLGMIIIIKKGVIWIPRKLYQPDFSWPQNPEETEGDFPILWAMNGPSGAPRWKCSRHPSAAEHQLCGHGWPSWPISRRCFDREPRIFFRLPRENRHLLD